MAKVQINNSDYIGIFALCTDAYTLVPSNLKTRVIKVLEKTLDVPVIPAIVSNSPLLGLFCVANANGILLPPITNEREIDDLRSRLKVEVGVLSSDFTALGNLMLVNDSAALVDPRIEGDTLDIIRDTLSVKITTGSISSVPLIGSLACATNRGIIVSPDAADKDLDHIEKVMKVPVEIGSVNRGSPYVGTGLLANGTGFIVGKETTGPELARIDEALGFI